ncbi:sterol desaturase family protein [Mycolicibacterium sp.]|uniref:sterol desaturase family protein n=1 Tax=Mycolicibacterium sp. TaxID=2320850 RepID=UPI001A30D4ED|nr:sterol desaturase family protein [Mycolicibacterium sp.]MBJ7340541.1 sterol desaturase family protein [Mycolicibacterium sp.]
MLQQFWQLAQNPIVYAIPVFVLFTFAEAAALRERRPSSRGYDRVDTTENVLAGAVSLLFMFGFKLATLVLFTAMWLYLTPLRVPTDEWWSWALLIVLVDLTWYCNHRFSHRFRIGWAGHRVHHSSTHFNFSSAFRLKWNPWSEAIFWLPLPLLGFEPWTIYVAYGFNMVYQFFLHTETVETLPKPVEYLMNTPSHHRVHHSTDPMYRDKNYGGMFIVWDRLFGTFQAERHRADYGLVGARPDDSMLQLQYGGYADILSDLRRARGLRARITCVFAPPESVPADM